ncbi:MAG: transposase [Arcobacter sp.]|nr:transposase [Arcobacter sp.]
MQTKTKRFKKSPRTFRAVTGLSIEKFNQLYKELVPLYEKSELKRLRKLKRQRKIGGGRKKELLLEDQLMMLLMYYRLYISQEFLGILFSLHNCNVSRQINYLHPLLAKIFKIPTRKIQLREVELTEDKLLEFFVDATEQQIQRPKKSQKLYYSGKKKKHTLKNQIVVDRKGKIYSVTKSTNGKKHDKKLFDETKLYSTKQVELTGDLGYHGISQMNLPHKKPKGKELTKEQKQFNKMLSSRRIKVEHSFGKMKIYQILSQRFRNPLSKHSIIFKNIAGLHNLMFT